MAKFRYLFRFYRGNVPIKAPLTHGLGVAAAAAPAQIASAIPIILLGLDARTPTELT
jgi:hypothetical protein